MIRLAVLQGFHLCAAVAAAVTAGFHGPVSYTHLFAALSVHRVQDGGRAIIVNLAGDTAAGIGPVSYTHLDVYKRQHWFYSYASSTLTFLSGHPRLIQRR